MYIHTLYTLTRRYELYCIDVYDISYTSTIIFDASFWTFFAGNRKEALPTGVMSENKVLHSICMV